MIRNFVTGVLMGGVVAGAGLGVVSQLAPMDRAKGADVVAATPAQEAVPDEASVTAKPLDLDAPAEAAEGPAAMAEAPEIAAKDPQAPGDALLAPAAEAGQPAPASIAPQLPDAPNTPENAPKADDIATAPATSPEAGAAEAAAPEVNANEQAEGDLAAPEADPTKAETGEATVAGAGSAMIAPQVQPETTEAEVEAAPATATELPAEIALDEGAAVVPQPAPKKVPDAAPETGADTGAEPAEDTAMETVVPEEEQPVLTPDAGLQDKEVAGVTTGRLPAITAEAPQDVAPEAAAAIDPASLPPVQRYAREFTNTAAKPLFAVLLVDPGTPELNRAELAALPFAVTFVIDPMAPNAAEMAAIYRAGGQEVVMLASGIPKGATAADLEQSFASLGNSVPEAVALIDTADATFQDNRGLAAEVVTLLAAEGRGLVTFDRGLNAADQVARREAVPAATIFRSLDDDGEDAPLIRRYLDRAAFKAAQEGSVVVIGTARPDTIAALMEWAIEGRSASVALAPITAVMTAN